MFRFALLAAWWLAPLTQAAPVMIAANGSSAFVIRLCTAATPAEQHAAHELQQALQVVCGVQIPIQTGGALPSAAFLVGRDTATEQLVPDVNWAALGREGFVVRTIGEHLILAGGHPRGTLYAVYSFLDEELGCRWFASGCEVLPKQPELLLPGANRSWVPRLEYRETFSHSAFDPDWAARNFNNGHSARLQEQHGGKTVYEGFVHTFFPLLPPDKHFATHPEWYSELNGQRTHHRSQLCLTNPAVAQAVTQAVRGWLQKNPRATIVSVSQNDWHGACQCAACKAVDAEEGSPSGALIRFVNRVAEAIEKEFPQVAIDTLAYQYTRKPPLLARPRANVIVRLCSIECCFSHPLESCPENAAFVADIVGWSKICNRLYIWDYVTNFSHYLLPHPNLDVLEPNIRFFVDHGVKGIFEQGEYNTPGGELLELRSYVIARLLRDPGYGARRAVDEFLPAYYGAAAEPLRRYLRLLHDKVAKDNIHVRCYAQPTSPCFTPELIAEAESLFQEAERLVTHDAVRLQRVRIAHLPVQFVMLERGGTWSRTASRSGKPVGPFGPGWSSKALAHRFLATAAAAKISHERESGGFEAYRERLAHLIDRKPPATPQGLEKVPANHLIDVQDDEFSLFREGELCGLRADPSASDGGCAWLRGSTPEWAVQFAIPADLLTRSKLYALHAVLKVNTSAQTGDVLSCGLYDTESKKGRLHFRLPARATSSGWETYDLGKFEAKGNPYVWFAGVKDAPADAEILIDRLCFVESEPET